MSGPALDTPQVQIATFESAADGGPEIVLRLTTVDKVDVYFKLDDLAFSMLTLTASSVARAVDARARTKSSHLFGRNQGETNE